MKGIHRRILVSLALVVIIAVLGLMAQQYTSLDWLVHQETHLRDFVRTHFMRSWLVGFLIYTCLSLIPGTSGKAVICGWLFGFWASLLMVDLALTLAALITFLASRVLFREAIESRFGLHLVQFRKKLETRAGFYLLMLRLMHTPFSLMNYCVGATNIVPVRTFWWTTQLGLLPTTMVFVYAGTRIPALAVLADQGLLAILDKSLIGALVSISIVPLMLRWVVAAITRRWPGRHTDCTS